MRLGFAIAAFLQADVLLLDEVFAVGDENFQRKCFGVIAAFKSQGGTILFVSHDAQAVERLCERSILLSSGEKVYDGPTHEAIARYRRLLADDLDPASGAGLPRVGNGEAEIGGAGCSTRRRREAAVPGRRAVRLEVDLVRTAEIEAPSLTSKCVNDGLLVAEDTVDPPRTIGWPGGRRRPTASLDVDRPSLAFGRFRVRARSRRRRGPNAPSVRRPRSRFSSIPEGRNEASSTSEERGVRGE